MVRWLFKACGGFRIACVEFSRLVSRASHHFCDSAFSDSAQTSALKVIPFPVSTSPLCVSSSTICSCPSVGCRVCRQFHSLCNA